LKFKTPRKNSGRQPLHEAFNSGVEGLRHAEMGMAETTTAHRSSLGIDRKMLLK
jgi:hypothetical protein